MELLNAPQCLFCKHLNWGNKEAITCDAFPDGIPATIWDNEILHDKPVPGDHGIMFEKEHSAGLKKYSEDQERDENGRFAGGGSTDASDKETGGAKANPFSEVPAAPGTTPIKDGEVRLYHQTDYKNIDEIAKEGITFEHAQGIEGPKSIYADEKGFYGKPTDIPTVEFAVSKDRAADKPFVYGDVTPKDIIAIHLPWQETARYLNEPDKIKDVLAGKFDFVTKERSEKDWRAIQYTKEKNGGTPEKGWKEYRDFPTRND